MKSLIENNKVSILIIFISLVAIIALAIYSSNRGKNEVSDNNEITDEKEIYSGAVSLDSIFSNLDVSLTDEEIPDFIDSSSIPEVMHTNFIGAMLNEEISNEYKLVYILNRATWKAFDIEPTQMGNNYGYIVSVKKETINKLAKQVFSNFEIPKNLQKGYYYLGINDLVCMEESCYYTYTTFGITGHVINGYEVKTIYNDNIATAQAIYIEYGTSVSLNDNLETLTTAVTLKDSYGGKKISSYQTYTFKYETSPDTTYIFDEFSQYYEDIPTYEYTFDNNNILLKVEEK